MLVECFVNRKNGGKKMSDRLLIDYDVANNCLSNLHSAEGGFMIAKPLPNCDNKTTISANRNLSRAAATMNSSRDIVFQAISSDRNKLADIVYNFKDLDQKMSSEMGAK